MRFVLVGARGQLGGELAPRLPGEVIALDRTRADLAHPETLPAVLEELSPDAVVNCAAYNFVNRAETECALAFTVNTLAVRALAQWCGSRDRLLVHFSTDHAFGLQTERRRPYTETDVPGPVSVYGTSKVAGEYLVLQLCGRHLVIRTCGLYGLRGRGGKKNFVEVMLQRAREGRPLRVIDDQVCTPTSAADLAEAVVGLNQREHAGLILYKHRSVSVVPLRPGDLRSRGQAAGSVSAGAADTIGSSA